MLPNVDLDATDVRRVTQMHAVLRAVCDELDTEETAGQALPFMLHLVWHESRRCRTRTQDANGPARGFPQFEAHRARDTLEYASGNKDKKPYWDVLVEACQGSTPSLTEVELEAAWSALPKWGTSGAATFPDGNPVEDLLITNDYFGAVLLRVALKKVPAALPNAVGDEAEYWARHWKRAGATADEKQRFLSAALEVDRLLLSGVHSRHSRFMLPSSDVTGAARPWGVEVVAPVVWGEMDAYQHVNNTVFLRWFENARIAWLERVRFPEKESAFGPVLRSATVEYLHGISYPDTVTVRVRAREIRTTSASLEYQVISQRNPGLAATGSTVVVLMDFQANEKIPIPDEAKTRIKTFDHL